MWKAFFVFMGSLFWVSPPPPRTKLSACAHEYMMVSGACPGGGGPKGPGPPPLEIKKQKKKSHQSKFEAISPIFCYFLVENIIFSVIF